MINIEKWKEDKQRPDEEGSIFPIGSKVSIAVAEITITFHKHKQKQKNGFPINLRKLLEFGLKHNQNHEGKS